MMSIRKATLYLLPCPIAEDAAQTLPANLLAIAAELRYFFVENLRSARRFLKLLDRDTDIDALHFSEIDKHQGADKNLLRNWLNAGYDIGLISEAGCPAIADPGSELVMAAHECGAIVKPVSGPNSLVLALMASGLNGQRFAFDGYLPVKEPLRSQRIRELEERSRKENQTQLFIETPYRNNALLLELTKVCAPATQLCVAMNLTGADEWIRTCRIANWKQDVPDLPKAPAVFLLLA